MSTREDEFLKKLRATFKVEADEHLQAIAAGLLALEKTPMPDEQVRLIETVFRAAHSLKGAARAVNLTDVESICQSMEDIFSAWKRREIEPSPEALDEVHRSLDDVTAILPPAQKPRDGGAKAPPVSQPSASSHAEPAAAPASAAEPAILERSSVGETVRISVAKLDTQLLEAEEMLAAKLTAGQRAADLGELAARMGQWEKEWASVQPDVRAIRQTLDKASPGGAHSQGLARMVEFCEWNHDYLRSLESRVATLQQTAQQDHLLIGKLVDDLLEDCKKLLMLPLTTLGTLLPKLVRDICRDQHKEADLVIRGEDVEIEKRLLEEMKDPFIHILRNCVDHGIETPGERTAQGKPPRANITLTVSPVNGNKVEFFISDDGRGIDPEKVKESACRHGLITPEEAHGLSDAGALELIFRADVSTSPIITQISGRGLGLAIVREKTEKLGGSVSVESRLRAGTTIRITLPIALTTFRGILIEVGKHQFIVPTAQVERVVRFQAEDVQTVEGRETLSVNGRALALARLEGVLELPPGEQNGDAPAASPAVILGTGDQRVAFAVDSVLDEQEVLVKRFGKPLSRVRNISGATVLGSGQVVPILNVADLLKSARKTAGMAARTAAKERPQEAEAASILVVEDSITSRMLLKGILESAGWQVKTAVDGVEAFTILRTERFNLVVSDVEMPRMNGFDLTARIRADKRLAELPVILVTALETREDRERGIDVGANAYLVKSNFDQSNLIEAVRRLV